jgi:hypothetical protein
MKRAVLLLALIAGGCCSLGALELFQSVDSGYYGDVGGLLRFSLRDLSRSTPVGLRAHAGLAYQFDSGDAAAARRIFINDNTGGTIQKYGLDVLVGMDLLYRFKQSKDLQLQGFAGPRGSFYFGHFTFLGNNESFTVRSNAFGIGVGLLALLSAGKRLTLSLNAGVDYYFPAKLYGHGTYYYTPDGVDENPRGTYTYADADEAVNQPGLLPAITLGIDYRLK